MSIDALFRGPLIDQALANHDEEAFKNLVSDDWKKYAFTETKSLTNGQPITESEWYAFCNTEGKVFRHTVFNNSIYAALAIHESEFIEYTMDVDFRAWLMKSGLAIEFEGIWIRMSQQTFESLSSKHQLIHPFDLWIDKESKRPANA